MKKMIKRTSALAISAFMAAQYIPFSAVAYTTTTCDLTIHPYVLNQTDYDNAKASSYVPTGKTADETNISTTLGIATAEDTTMTFNITRVTDTGAAHSDTSHNLIGVRSATDLPDGYYKITPANKTDTDARFKDAESFIIQIPVPDSGSVNRDVHIYPKFTDNNDNDNTETPGQETPTSGDKHNVTLTKTDNSSTPVAVPGAIYKLYYKDAAGKWVAGSATYTTNENGVITVTGLPLGKYYFVEQSAPTGYLLDQEPIAFTIDGATAATVSPVNDKDLTVQKTIANDGAGTVYNWVITADVPSKPENLLSYTITDTYSGLSSTAADITVSIAGMTAGTDYTVDKSTAGTIVIALTSTGIGQLTGTSFDINVSTKLAASATAATNSASINYAYAYDPTTDTDPDPDKDDIIDDANIPDPDPNDPGNSENPTPKDFPTPGGSPDPEDPYTDQVTPGTFTISNVNGEDELGGATYEVRKADGSTVVVTKPDNDDAAATNPKIAVVSNLAPGHYKIYQTAVDSGHLLNQVPIDIYVGKDGNIYSDAACTAANQIINDKGTVDTADDVANQVKFYNEPISNKFSLPFTGTTATIIFTVTGLILMAGTLFFIIILKKRDDDDEEQENN
ncbi:SpaA isopeptide-forming pilin-related protein [Ruminococcus flavefaciens]|uniref:SpaA isopeptide-forming pilin-related protein n=1 Tax=Ruminococcus flavefaciens TaxID=1265 RepID=UPI00048CEAD1|nr:SpaA isopeptide-forming pilin-related protein [Ruminococcus flavefaciens]